jgi:hypothetical protein
MSRARDNDDDDLVTSVAPVSKKAKTTTTIMTTIPPGKQWFIEQLKPGMIIQKDDYMVLQCKSKSGVRHFDKNGRKGQFLKIEFADQTKQTIWMTFFNDGNTLCEIVDGFVKETGKYQIFGFEVKANTFNNVTTKQLQYRSNHSKIAEYVEEENEETEKFVEEIPFVHDLKSFFDAYQKNPEYCCHFLAVILNQTEIIPPKQAGKKERCIISLGDDSGYRIDITRFGKDAHIQYYLKSVILLQNAKIQMNEYQEKIKYELFPFVSSIKVIEPTIHDDPINNKYLSSPRFTELKRAFTTTSSCNPNEYIDLSQQTMRDGSASVNYLELNEAQRTGKIYNNPNQYVRRDGGYIENLLSQARKILADHHPSSSNPEQSGGESEQDYNHPETFASSSSANDDAEILSQLPPDETVTFLGQIVEIKAINKNSGGTLIVPLCANSQHSLPPATVYHDESKSYICKKGDHIETHCKHSLWGIMTVCDIATGKKVSGVSFNVGQILPPELRDISNFLMHLKSTMNNTVTPLEPNDEVVYNDLLQKQLNRYVEQENGVYLCVVALQRDKSLNPNPESRQTGMNVKFLQMLTPDWNLETLQ